MIERFAFLADKIGLEAVRFGTSHSGLLSKLADGDPGSGGRDLGDTLINLAIAGVILTPLIAAVSFLASEFYSSSIENNNEEKNN